MERRVLDALAGKSREEIQRIVEELTILLKTMRADDSFGRKRECPQDEFCFRCTENCYSHNID